MRKNMIAGLLAAAAMLPGAAMAQAWHGRGDDDRGKKEDARPAPKPQQQPRQQQQPQPRGRDQARHDMPMPSVGQPVQRFQNQGGARPQPNGNGGPDGSYGGRRISGTGGPMPQRSQPDRGNGNTRGNGGSTWQQQGRPTQQPERANVQDRNRDGRPDRGGTWQDRDRNGGSAAGNGRNRGNDGRSDWRDRGNQGRPNWTDNRGDRGNWNRDWRRNNQYDWNRYRSQNRYQYRLPRYYAPGGWGYGYQRYGIGSILNDLFYQPNYWIADPYSYRLPPVDEPYRWVRYYNDALLVDTYSGQVVDVVHDIFW